MLEKVGQEQYISTLNLTKDYWQILMATLDKEKTGFGTPWGLFQFKRMSFGQRLVEQILPSHQEYVAAYIDDIIIFSPDWEAHPQHL